MPLSLVYRISIGAELQRWGKTPAQQAAVADPLLFKCGRLPGAGRGHGALPDGLPDEAAVGEQRGRGEPGPATRQV